jgi:hypothetical protein
MPINVIGDSFETHVTVCTEKLYNITWAFLLTCSHVGFHMCLSINGFYFSNF